MDNSKIENMLNLALDATPGERARSLNLDVGFDGEENTWELIVKYSGSLSRLEEEGIRVTELLNEYAVLVVPESGIGRLAEVPEIEYIEKPTSGRSAGNRIHRETKEAVFRCRAGKDSLLCHRSAECPL